MIFFMEKEHGTMGCITSWQSDQVWKFEELSRCKVGIAGGLQYYGAVIGGVKSVHWGTVYMALYSDFPCTCQCLRSW